MPRKAGPHNIQMEPELRERRKNDLPKGMVKAIKGLRYRVPSDLPDEMAAIAHRAFERYVDVMEGKVSFRQAPSVIKAATAVRDEICGPLAKDINVKGTMSLEMLIARAAQEELDDGETQA
jgi:hypothetical protein